MKFLIERSALVDTMAAITRIVQKGGDLPIRACVKIVAKDDRLSITGLDAHVWVTMSVPADIAIGGAVAVNASLFADAAKACPIGSQIEFAGTVADPSQAAPDATATPDFGHLRAGKARFRLPLLPAADFPAGHDLSAARSFTLPMADLRYLIGRAAHAMSLDEAKYYLGGVHLDLAVSQDDGERRVLRGEATDSFRLAVTEIPAEGETEDAMADLEHMPILPRQTVGHIMRFADGDGAVHIRMTSTLMAFDFADTVMVTRLVDAAFPAVQKALDMTAQLPFMVELARAGLSDLVGRLSPFTGTAKEKAIRLDFTGPLLTVTARAEDGGEASDEVETRGLRVRADGSDAADTITLKFQTKFLREALEAGSGDRVVFGIDPNAEAVRLDFPDDPRLRLVLMKFR